MNTNNISLPNAIKTVVESIIKESNYCLPGRVVEVIDGVKRKVSVVPEIKKTYLDGSELNPPIIENVPLMYYGSESGILHFKIEVGQKVLLIFSQRSIDNWLSLGDTTTPGVRRFNDLTDAIAIPGVQAFKDHELIEDADTNFLRTKDLDFTIDVKNKKFTLKNDIEDLAGLMSDLLDEIIAIQTIGSPPQHTLSPTSITNLTAIKTKFSNLLKES